jgi:cobalt-zinc-cadmium efflux system outer membrane protein
MLTGAPLDADTAVAVALINSPHVQVILGDLGVARADLIEASTISNPVFGAELRFPADPFHPFEFRLAQSLFDLMQLPKRRRLGEAAFEAARLRVTAEILDFGADVRMSYHDLLAASQRAAMSRTVAEAAHAAADLAQRQHDAGNTTDLELETEQSHYDEAKLRLAHDEAELLADSERLTQLMGIRDRAIAWRMADAFPPVADRELTDVELEQAASARRLDVAIARAEVRGARQNIPIARLSSLGDAVLDVHLQRDAVGSKTTGPGIDLPIPIFGRGAAARTRAEAQYLRSEQRLAELTLAAGSELRMTRDRLQAARMRVADYRDVVVPRSERIAAATQLRTNAMLVGIYDLLRAKESEAMTKRDYVEAQHDYWTARDELERALNGTGSTMAMPASDHHDQTAATSNASAGGHLQ